MFSTSVLLDLTDCFSPIHADHRKSAMFWITGILMLSVAKVSHTLTSRSECTADNPSTGHCYAFVTDQRPEGRANWTSAVTYCRQSGGQLVSIYDSTVEATVESLLQKRGETNPVWTAAVQEDARDLMGNPESLWRWVQDCPGCNEKTVCSSAGGPLDLAFLIDSAASFPPGAWTRVLKLMTSLLSSMRVGPEAVRVAVVDSSGVVFPLTKYTTASEVTTAISKLLPGAGSDSLADLLHNARTQVFNGGASGDRPGVPDVVIAVTSSTQPGVDDEYLVGEATLISLQAIQVFAIGTTRAVQQSLLAIISAPPGEQNNTYFTVTSYLQLTDKTFIAVIVSRICTFHRIHISMLKTATLSQGCMLEWEATRDFTVDRTQEAAALGGVIPSTCIQACNAAGYLYAALQMSDSCYCGNEFGQHGSTDSCTLPCRDNPALFCGGYSRSAVYRIDGKYANWSYNQPNNLDGYQWCAAIDRYINATFDDQHCDVNYRYICQLATTTSCSGSEQPPSNILLLGMCLYVSSTLDTWFRARQTCRQMDGDLIVINSETVRLAVAQMLTEQNVVERYIWVGLYRVNYFWNDEIGGGTELNFNHFGLKQPRPADGSNQLRCVYIDPRYSYAWYTADCTDEFNFICQFEYSATTGGPATGSTTEEQYPSWFIALLILAILLFLLILLLILLLTIRKCRQCCGMSAVAPKSLDVRPKAPIPMSEPILQVSMDTPTTSTDNLM